MAKPTFSSTTAALNVYLGGRLREIDALTRHKPPSLVVPELLSTATPVPIIRSRFGGPKRRLYFDFYCLFWVKSDICAPNFSKTTPSRTPFETCYVFSLTPTFQQGIWLTKTKKIDWDIASQKSILTKIDKYTRFCKIYCSSSSGSFSIPTIAVVSTRRLVLHYVFYNEIKPIFDVDIDV